ncbi:MAG: hypothetical protein Q7R49_07340 [Candidatus Daviesbacteria bacterium]|nr:hypothetical protein [Candidatus Daviesbacteria bacterium]
MAERGKDRGIQKSEASHPKNDRWNPQAMLDRTLGSMLVLRTLGYTFSVVETDSDIPKEVMGIHTNTRGQPDYLVIDLDNGDEDEISLDKIKEFRLTKPHNLTS